jgi:hypothetical protein
MAEPMTPEQVPGDLVELGVEASDDYTDRAEQWTSGDHVRAILAAVLPADRAAALREAAAAAEVKPGTPWLHFAGWLRTRADQIEQENHHA